MAMSGPKLDRKITLERFTFTTDEGSGEQVKTWSSLGDVWANKKDTSDSERVRSAEVAAEISTRFTIRYDSAWSDVGPLDRLVYEGRTFDIVGTKETEDGRRRFIEISASARAD